MNKIPGVASSQAAFALRSTYHTTLRATPGQLVFGRDMILNVQYQSDWTAIKSRKTGTYL